MEGDMHRQITLRRGNLESGARQLMAITPNRQRPGPKIGSLTFLNLSPKQIPDVRPELAAWAIDTMYDDVPRMGFWKIALIDFVTELRRVRSSVD